MYDFLDQIEASVRANLYYVALFSSLAIPDICGAIDSDDGNATGEKYRNWFDKYVGSKYGRHFTGEDCYLFRCSLLHQGSTMHAKSEFARVLFVAPGANSNLLHNNIINGAFNIDVRIFCLDLLASARQWLSEVSNTDLFKSNFDKLIRRYPNGLAPYIVGGPVIG